MTIPRQNIEKLCALARLALDPEQLQRVQQDLERIIGMVDAISGVATTAIEPLAHPLDASARLRPDEVTEQVDRDALQQSAPVTRDGLYLVPRVIE
jgi:aspartyl-tRNA(Asn)/glutamyl-tRNA(Gln) amidotransferase subunit C